MKDVAIVFDCGATNVRVVAINSVGQIVASHSMPNETDEDPYFPTGKIWDLDKLWGKLCKASQIVTSEIDKNCIVGATVTTFGVDGTFTDEQGNLLYPVISWQCQRTGTIINNIDKYIPLERLYNISGVYPYAFNTINKMIWFKENRPEIIDNSHRFLFMPSLIINRLSGVFKNDVTMMGTSMMGELAKRDFSDEIFSELGLNKACFGLLAEPGEKAGEVSIQASKVTGLPSGLPVFIAGHDTQFALFGSGALANQPVLSSGTWEILMSRCDSYQTSELEFVNNLTIELDVESGFYNIGQNWLSSGVLEWFSQHFYPELKDAELYDTMIREAENEMPGANGIMINPDFYNDGSNSGEGKICGLTIGTKRSQIYRAFLESLAFRLREGLEALELSGSFKTERIICVGGGSKNRLWNQIRADVCNCPVQLIAQKETTVLGASMFVFKGAGLYKSATEASKKINYNPIVINPSVNAEIYDKLYKNYKVFKSE